MPLRRSRRLPAAPVEAPPDPPPALVPVFLRMLWGRVGSTLAMQLLGTDPAVGFTRTYPFEMRRAAALLWYARALAGQQPEPAEEWMTDPQALWWIDPTALFSRTSGDPLTYGPAGEIRGQLHRDAVAGLWQAFSAAVRAEQPEARLYAEKYGGFGEDLAAAGVPVRFVDLVRDPRDVWASVRAFDAKRGFFGFGRGEQQSEGAYLAAFCEALRRRFVEMAGETAGCERLIVRYEDLATDPVGQCGRLGGWLGVELDPSVAETRREEFQHHITAQSVDASIGRWRADVPEPELAVLRGVLGEHAAGYDYAL